MRRTSSTVRARTPHPSPSIAPWNRSASRTTRPVEATLRHGNFHWISGVDCCTAGRGERFLVTPALTCAFPMWTSMWTSVNHTSDIPGRRRSPGVDTRTVVSWQDARTENHIAPSAERRRDDARPRPSHPSPHAGAASARAALRVGARTAARDPVRQRPVPSPAAGQGRLGQRRGRTSRARRGRAVVLGPRGGAGRHRSRRAGDHRGDAPRARRGARPPAPIGRRGPATEATRTSTSSPSGRSGSRRTVARRRSASRRTRSGRSGRWTPRRAMPRPSRSACSSSGRRARLRRRTTWSRDERGPATQRLAPQPHVPTAVDGACDLVHR